MTWNLISTIELGACDESCRVAQTLAASQDGVLILGTSRKRHPVGERRLPERGRDLLDRGRARGVRDGRSAVLRRRGDRRGFGRCPGRRLRRLSGERLELGCRGRLAGDRRAGRGYAPAPRHGHRRHPAGACRGSVPGRVVHDAALERTRGRPVDARCHGRPGHPPTPRVRRRRVRAGGHVRRPAPRLRLRRRRDVGRAADESSTSPAARSPTSPPRPTRSCSSPTPTAR